MTEADRPALDLDNIKERWEEYEDVSPMPLIAEVRRLRPYESIVCDIEREMAGAVPDAGDTLDGDVAALRMDRDALQARIDAALAVHHRAYSNRDGTQWFCACLHDWPCATVAALEGKP